MDKPRLTLTELNAAAPHDQGGKKEGQGKEGVVVCRWVMQNVQQANFQVAEGLTHCDLLRGLHARVAALYGILHGFEAPESHAWVLCLIHSLQKVLPAVLHSFEPLAVGLSSLLQFIQSIISKSFRLTTSPEQVMMQTLTWKRSRSDHSADNLQ